jgi:hypothetical protein
VLAKSLKSEQAKEPAAVPSAKAQQLADTLTSAKA